ncbi:HlyD family secretion protein [Bradyrhizobium jicamae]|uniref:HlyD family secretion protein n=1 Tax=Bradyrhizobium jicamae TaxID=280332 RepID=UPI001BAE0F1B|nr:HlyD family secretion protein [Bradyrhizobium jicamae]MBR0935585.1 HlyD family secretion protein [Bradyrhizobium jicamae]
MHLDLSLLAGWTGDRKAFRGSAAMTAAAAGPAVSFDGAIDRAPAKSNATVPARSFIERLRRPLIWGVPALVAAFGAAMYFSDEPYVSTDDAFVRAAKITVNARVAGQAVEIAVHDNERVHQGQVLFRIDPEPYQIAVDQAEAQLGTARLQIDALKATYRQQQAELQSARDTAAYDEREYERKKALVVSDFTPRATFDRADTDLKVARQHVASIEQQVANTVAALDGNPDIEIDRHPTVRAARAQLDRARLNLSYATVRAPDDGVVTRVDDLQIGGFVNPGAPVFSLLSSHRIWIEANFRETGLTHMHPGQQATIDVDAYPGHALKAHIVSMSPGTGSDFSVLPPENATGNWVKVVQRLPVRLELDEVDPNRPLFSGISVTARVDTGYRRNWHHPLQLANAEEIK